MGGFIYFVFGGFFVRWGGVKHHWSAILYSKCSALRFGEHNHVYSDSVRVAFSFSRFLGGLFDLVASVDFTPLVIPQFVFVLYPPHLGKVCGRFAFMLYLSSKREGQIQIPGPVIFFFIQATWSGPPCGRNC